MPVPDASALFFVQLALSWLPADKMRVTVFGSTGTTGRLTVRKLLESPDQHEVVAVARNPGALDDLKASVDAARLVLTKGDLMDPATVAAAVQGADVVVYTAGVATIQQAATQKTTVYSMGMCTDFAWCTGTNARSAAVNVSVLL